RSIDEALRSVNYEGKITINIKSGVYDEDVVIEGFNGVLTLVTTDGTVSIRTMHCRDISGDLQINGDFLFYGSKQMEGGTTTALAFRAVNSFHIYSKLSFIGEEKGDYAFKLFHSKGSIVNGYESNNFTYGILVGHNSHVYLTGNVSNNSERASLISENGSIVSLPIESDIPLQ